jgi:hypothetical protein
MNEIIKNEIFCNEILNVCSVNMVNIPNSIERRHAKITQDGDYEYKIITYKIVLIAKVNFLL